MRVKKLAMTKQQMELGLEQPLGFRRAVPRQRRQTRARWWFAQMRQVVSNAAEPASTGSSEVQQASLALDPKSTQAGLSRPVLVGARASARFNPREIGALESGEPARRSVAEAA